MKKRKVLSIGLLVAVMSTACQKEVVSVGVHNTCSFSVESSDKVTDTSVGWTPIAAGARSNVYQDGIRDSYRVVIRRSEFRFRVIQRSELAPAESDSVYDIEYTLTVADCNELDR
ncbi:MAG: hypothetical protein ACI9C1_001755 [Candidatus Aldehydirespiratoraceae bacterium]